MPGYPKDTSGIYAFEVMGKRFVYDIHTATPFEIDGLTWDVLNAIGDSSRGEIIEQLKDDYRRDEITSVLSSLDRLQDGEELFTPAEIVEDANAGIDVPLGVLVLQVAHDCNLRCKYCYAEFGKYGGSRALMNEEVGERAIDFLIENSGERKTLQVVFFGGEPLLNFKLIRHLVRYARGREREKEFHFHVTTNGVLLTEEVSEHLSDNGFSMIVSLDGPAEIHDAVRVFPGGRRSHRVVLENIRKAMSYPVWDQTTIRGTVSSGNLDISKQIDYLFDQGFDRISVEPAMDVPDNPYAIRERHLSALAAGYREFARSYRRRIRNGGAPRFFHFINLLKLIHSASVKRASCTAGTGYMAVSTNGDIYPCYKLDGLEDWKMGDVFNGIEDGKKSIWKTTRDVDSNEVCSECWAKYLCGGGCRAHRILLSGDVNTPYPLACEITRIRLRNAIWLHSELGEDLLERLLNHGN